jgi:hypothetical protein
MQEADFHALNSNVLWLSYGLMASLGFMAHRTHFCTMGAIVDVLSFGAWKRACQVLLAMAVSLLGFAILVGLGAINPAQTLYASAKWFWLSDALGGVMFGAGMVLASGCGNKTLIRMGSGNLKSWVVFLVMGLAAWATLKGVTAVFRVNVLETFYWVLPGGGSIAEWLWGHSALDNVSLMGLPLHATAFTLTGLALSFVMILASVGLLNHHEARPLGFGELFEQLYPGLLVGLVVTLAWTLSGVVGHVSESPLTLEEVFLASQSGKVEAVTFVSPMAYLLDWLVFYSDASKVLGYASICALGVASGSLLSALLGRNFRWEGFGSTEDLGTHLIGALLMGVGGVVAMGCTFGQGMSGFSTLSINAIEVVIFIVLGCIMAYRYQTWRLEQML